MTDTGHVDSGYNYGVDTVLYGVYNNFHCGIVKDNEVIIFPTRLKKRPDVNNESGDGIDYKYCGFNAYVPDKYASGYSDCELVMLFIGVTEENEWIAPVIFGAAVCEAIMIGLSPSVNTTGARGLFITFLFLLVTLLRLVILAFRQAKGWTREV